ncbi:MAG: thiamine diphosphokinase [Clostridia bacterium]|nr:thiamine diphosphokinase [Clostridia bacterium]
MDNVCLIISGGVFSDDPPVPRDASCVIACDRGWQYAERLGIVPDVILGDFDSSAPPVRTDVPVLTFPVRKDDTDTMLAARHALEKGYRDITVCCALGGRFDHTLANLQTAAFIVSRGGRCRLLGRNTELIAFTRGTVRLPRRKGYKLGVFSLSDRCENVTLRGTDYECENIVLSSAFPLGACNAWAADTAEISVGNGILLAVSSSEA